jgi:ribosomal protein L30/L7E
MKDWPFEKIVIDTTSSEDWKSYEDQILKHLGLKRINTKPIINSSEDNNEI